MVDRGGAFRIMKPALTGLAQTIQGLVGAARNINKPVVEAPLDKCVHYCGFRYGGQEYNPYETYQIEFQQGRPIQEVRRHFIEFLKFYRPRHMGEALGAPLSRKYALWVYPWRNIDPRQWEKYGWSSTLNAYPDILTHFCEEGISSFRIEEEFFWLERILWSISRQGYQPAKYPHADAWELHADDGARAYLLLDGNHRAGALTAIGCSKTLVVSCSAVIKEQDVEAWPAVRKGQMNREDALALFRAYFRGKPLWARSESPAPILAPPGWEKMYL
jgi:hypothetical protein